MKKFIRLLIIPVLFLSPYCFGQPVNTMSPEQAYLSQESAAKFDSLRKAAKASFQGILLYPDDIRNSVLEVSQYPDLIVLLKNKERMGRGELDKYLAGMPKETRDAVDKLKAYPDVIDILDKNIVVSSLLGEMVKEKKETIIQVVKRMSDSVQQGHSEAVDAWTEKMQQDPEAVKELQSAAEAYAKKNNLPSPNQPKTEIQAAEGANPYGYYVNEENTVIIQEMPSDDMMQYMLANQAMYAALFSIAVYHHGMYPNDYYWHAYDDHYEDNWNQYQENLENISNGLDELNNNIDEIQENRQEAKDKMAEKKEEAGARREEAASRKEDIQSKRASAGTSDAKRIGLSSEQKMQIDNRSMNIGDGRNQYAQRGSLSSRQQVDRASQYHSGSWSQGSRASSSQSRGSRGSYSGSRPSGGGSRPTGGGGRGGRGR